MHKTRSKISWYCDSPVKHKIWQTFYIHIKKMISGFSLRSDRRKTSHHSSHWYKNKSVVKTPWLPLWWSISTTFGSGNKFTLHWSKASAAERALQGRQEWTAQKQLILLGKWLLPKDKYRSPSTSNQQLPTTTSSCSKNVHLMHFGKVK